MGLSKQVRLGWVRHGRAWLGMGPKGTGVQGHSVGLARFGTVGQGLVRVPRGRH